MSINYFENLNLLNGDFDSLRIVFFEAKHRECNALKNKGLLTKKDFFDINDMKKINFSDSKTENINSKKTFVYDFLSSMRQRMNDPLGVRTKKY